MNISSQELKQISKLDENRSEPQTLEELFSDGKEQASNEFIRKYTEEFCQKYCNENVSKYFEEKTKEHDMCMKERQAGVNTSNAITGAIASWAIIGIVMLARSCINFDKGPKFKV